MKRILMVAAACLSLAACATATPYQPLTTKGPATGGYTEVKVNDDRFRVSFAGNSLTSRETVERYLLFRSAEVTLAQGFDWFALADRHTDRKSSAYWSSNYGWGGGYWAPSWSFWGGPWGGPYWGGGPWGYGYGPWGHNSGYIDQIDRYQATAEIVLGKGPKPANDPAAFDARQVVQNLGPIVVRPPVAATVTPTTQAAPAPTAG